MIYRAHLSNADGSFWKIVPLRNPDSEITVPEDFDPKLLGHSELKFIRFKLIKTQRNVAYYKQMTSND